MHPKSPDRPSQRQLQFPLLETIEHAGAISARDAAAALADRFCLTGDLTAETVTTGDGQVVNLWQRHARWAAQKCRAMGFLTSDQARQWTLTDEGEEALRQARPAIVITVHPDAAGMPLAAQIDIAIDVPTIHTLRLADARDLSWIPDGQIPLIVTSVPYHDLVSYESVPGQLGDVSDYDAFVAQLTQALAEMARVLMPGGRLVCNVGDVLRSRKQHGAHHMLPLHADIMTTSRRLGLHNLTGIIWRKISTANYEQGPGGILGKPGSPNGIIKQETEHLLFFRRPGPYRSPTPAQQIASHITPAEYQAWFKPIWDDIPGARATMHPCPFPVEIAYRLIRMLSFAGDTVLDPFCGSASTTLAAMKAGRNSIGADIAPSYLAGALARIEREAPALIRRVQTRGG